MADRTEAQNAIGNLKMEISGFGRLLAGGWSSGERQTEPRRASPARPERGWNLYRSLLVCVLAIY